MRRSHLACILLLAVPAAAAAQEADRYALEKTADGYVRMDRKTGEMSLCTERSGQLVCKLAADERTAVETEMDRVTARLEDLEKRLAAVENQSVRVPGLPTDEELEKSLTYMQRFFRTFMDTVKDFETDTKPPEKPVAPPQKT